MDIELFSDISRIENALARHSCIEALAWCSENKTVRRKIKACYHRILFRSFPPILFLFLARRVSWSLTSACKKTSNSKSAENHGSDCIFQRNSSFPHLAQIRQLSALLAFESNTTCGPDKVCSACYQSFFAHLSPVFVRPFQVEDPC